MSRTVRTLATVVMVALSSWSCGSTGPDTMPEVAAIVVSPASSTLALDAQLPLQAQVRDESGAIVSGANVTWSVQDPRIVSISSEGVVTALAVGTSQVAASALGKSGLATITVAPGAVARIDVTPATLSLQAGQTQQLVAALKDARGNVLTGKAVVWTSDNSQVAAPHSTGMLTADATTSRSGVARISASVGGVNGMATITVNPGAVATVMVAAPSKNVKAGHTMQLAATAMDNKGNTVPNQSFVWSSSNNNTATVSASGVVTAKRSGSVTITAQSSGGKSGSTQVDVK